MRITENHINNTIKQYTFRQTDHAFMVFSVFIIESGKHKILIHSGKTWMFHEVVARLGSDLTHIAFQHVEGDEMANIKALVEKYPETQVICTRLAANTIMDIFPDLYENLMPLKDKETLQLEYGQFSLITTPHFPHGWDSCMFCLHTNSGENILFSGDFGTQSANVDNVDVENQLQLIKDFGYLNLDTTCLKMMSKLTSKKINMMLPMHGPIHNEKQCKDVMQRYTQESLNHIKHYLEQA